MDIIIPQLIVLVVIVAMFYLAFKYDKTKITTQNMTLVTILCVLTAVLSKTLSIKFPPGQPIFVISLAVTMAVLIGILFSPKLAIIAGLITDIIGILLGAAGGDASLPFLGFTLTAMLSCLIPSLLVRFTKKYNSLTLNALIVGILVIAIGAASFYLFSVDSISIDQTENKLTDGLRYAIIGTLIIISLLIVILNYFVAKTFNKNNSNMYLTTAHITLIVLVVEIVSSIILTSLWINIMYGVPFIVGAATRVIKTVLSLPINVIVIYVVLRYIPEQFKRHLIKDEKKTV